MREAFPNTLFEGDGWQRLLARAAMVPAALIDNTFGFELRLGQPERAADFCVSLKAGSDTTSEFLAFPEIETYSEDTPPGKLLPVRLKIDSKRRLAHQSLAKFLSEIHREGSLANILVPSRSIILEYDVIDLEVGKSPAPAVFWGLPDNLSPDQMSDVVEVLDIVQDRFGSLAQDNDRQDASHHPNFDMLHQVANAAEPYGRVSQVGTFVGRERNDVRILIGISDSSSIRDFLRDIDWSGNIALVEKVLSEFHADNRKFGVSLDIASTQVGPRIGLEVAMKGGWFGTRIADWQPLIDILVANGWCRADKANGLRQWCGYIRLFGPTMWLLLKGINHLKISIRGDESLEAKAYVGARRVPADDVGFG